MVLQRRANEVSLIIEDNGIGFELNTPSAAHGGLGLIGMRERAVFVGGKVIIQASRRKGVAVFVRIPVRNRAKRAGRGE
jgi:signal transduction histidine kinase